MDPLTEREGATAARGGRRRPAPVLFVGGTGRSGSHILARLLSKSRHYTLVPVEVRFHVDEGGFPDLLAGGVTKEQFLRRMRGFWWKGFQTDRWRGLHRLVPRERFDAALAAFEEGFERDPEAACRRLFLDLLQGVKGGRPDAAILEQSCDTVAEAETLLRLFPEARFVHAVRDGRDASASRVSQRRWLVYPRTRRQGLAWWERRLRRVDRGVRAIPDDQVLEVELGDLLERGATRRAQVGRLARFAGIRRSKRMRRFLRAQMSPQTANTGRWRQGLGRRRRREVNRRYAEILARLERDRVSCAPLLRRAYERDSEPE